MQTDLKSNQNLKHALYSKKCKKILHLTMTDKKIFFWKCTCIHKYTIFALYISVNLKLYFNK